MEILYYLSKWKPVSLPINRIYMCAHTHIHTHAHMHTRTEYQTVVKF